MTYTALVVASNPKAAVGKYFSQHFGPLKPNPKTVKVRVLPEPNPREFNLKLWEISYTPEEKMK